MHTVVTTPTFERQAKAAGLAEDAVLAMVATIAADPLAGDVMVGTGGARKVRHAGRGRGKSGGFRTIHFYAGPDAPVFLLALVDKGERANLSRSERDQIAAILPRIVAAYRGE